MGSIPTRDQVEAIGRGPEPHRHLWSRIEDLLNARAPRWRPRIDAFGQIRAIEEREAGRRWLDEEVFEGMVKAVLSNQIDWAKIERIIPELKIPFAGFDVRHYAALSEEDVKRSLVPWFTQQRAGSMTLGSSLKHLIKAAQKLCGYSEQYGSLENFVTSLLQRSGSDPKQLVMRLGSYGSEYKLPAMGVPIAAEAMKNIGFDVAKADRHVCRALGAFGIVKFANWKDTSGNKAPLASESEYLHVMEAMEIFATGVGVRPAFLDNAIWILCAQSGVHLTNHDLAGLTV